MMRTFFAVVVLVAAGATLTAHQQSAAQVNTTFDGYWIGVGYIGVKELRIGIEVTRAQEGPKVSFASLDRGSVERSASNIVTGRAAIEVRRAHTQGQLRGHPRRDGTTTGWCVAAVGHGDAGEA